MRDRVLSADAASGSEIWLTAGRGVARSSEITMAGLIHTVTYILTIGEIRRDVNEASHAIEIPVAPPTRTPHIAWIDAGLQALAAGGPDSVRIEALAKSLGVTRGGFYGHFA